jgi:hypothetical protein
VGHPIPGSTTRQGATRQTRPAGGRRPAGIFGARWPSPVPLSAVSDVLFQLVPYEPRGFRETEGASAGTPGVGWCALWGSTGGFVSNSWWGIRICGRHLLVEMGLDRTQVLVMGQDEFVREVEDTDAPVRELQGDADGEVEVVVPVADLSGGKDLLAGSWGSPVGRPRPWCSRIRPCHRGHEAGRSPWTIHRLACGTGRGRGRPYAATCAGERARSPRSGARTSSPSAGVCRPGPQH